MTIRTTLGQLKQKQIRLYLTSLGVAIGAFAITTTIALFSIANNYVSQNANPNNAKISILKPDEFNTGKLPGRLTARHFQSIHSNFGTQALVSPRLILKRTVVGEHYQSDFEVIGTDNVWITLRNAMIEQGRFITSADNSFQRPIAILGSESSKSLLFNLEPVGQHILIDNIEYVVVGILEKSKFPFQENYDRQVIIPYKNALSTWSLDQQNLEIDVFTNDKISNKSLQNYLDRESYFNPLTAPVARISSANSTVEEFREFTSVLRIGGIVVGFVTVFVAAIGTGITAYITTKERVYELGLRKAVGAREIDIFLLVFYQHTIIGLSGILIGSAMSFLLVSRLSMLFGISTSFPFLNIGYALFAMVIIIEVFGIIPCIKASRMSPIGALNEAPL